jgi:uncharacterized repeat protein (TIGR02543 family)
VVLTSIISQAFYGCNGLTSITNLSTTPQVITSLVFTYVNTTTCTLTVPTAATDLYVAADVWKDFTNIVDGGFIFTVKVNNPAWGSVSGTAQGLYASGTTIEITATPVGSNFLYWTDRSGTQVSTSATLTFALTQDSVLTAYFAPINYTITYNDLNGASHSNPATYTIESATITLTNPSARTGYIFTGWQEGSSIPAGSTDNKTFTAQWTDNRDALIEQLQQRIGALQTDSVALRSNIAGLVDDTVRLYTALQTAQGIHDTVRIPEFIHDTVTINNTDSINSLNARLADLQKQLNAATSDKNALQTQLNTATSDKNTLQTQLNTANSNISALNEQISDLQSQLTTCQNNRANPTAVVETLRATSLQSSGSATLDISHLPAGMYIIKVGDKAAKVVKE